MLNYHRKNWINLKKSKNYLPKKEYSNKLECFYFFPYVIEKENFERILNKLREIVNNKIKRKMQKRKKDTKIKA